MIINKVITGYVVQSYDTETNEYINQAFIASDEVEYETEDGDSVNQDEIDKVGYLSFDMVQPKELEN